MQDYSDHAWPEITGIDTANSATTVVTPYPIPNAYPTYGSGMWIDSEFEAARQCAKAVEFYSDEQRKRIIKSVAAYYAVEL